MPKTTQQNVERLARGVIAHLDKGSPSERRHRASALIEALVRTVIDEQLDPYQIMEHFTAEFVTQLRVGNPACPCEDCRAELN